ncbi:lipopolysaccharide biosynthesis protein [Polymorphobacter multimanifer]|uniref:lipopolysaccharide biosynthesis protein n=1 Tax=Polymorphobacter multimanifer TaxID=1070431 RepID=UPI00166B59A0|nr:lipopolysaccharide biosynthesis protein [Polymorphobacter multimanifer]GGI67775.1 lipopolysaccharide biosynthesis protein [Polymorphobacter multimanifer]
MKDLLTRGAFWLAATRLLVTVIGFASTVLLARLLMPEDFGLVAIAITVAALAGSVSELSLSSALVQHENPQRHHFDSAWTLNILRAALLAAVLAAAAWPVAALYGDQRLVGIMLVIAGTRLLGGFGNPRLVVFTRNLVFRQEFAMGVSQKLLGFVVALAVAVIYKSYWALVAGGAAAQLLGVALSYALLPYRPRLRLRGGRELFAFSMWLTLGRVVNTVNWRSDQLFIGYFLGSNMLGQYSFGDNLAALPTREATSPVAQTLFPAFSRLTHDRERLRAAYLRGQSLVSAVGLPIGFGLALIAEPLVVLAVGDKWLPAVVVIQILAGVFALQTLSSSLQPLAMALAETRSLFHRDLVNLGIRLPLIVIGLVTGGLIGVLLARVVSGLSGMAINMALVRRLIGIPIGEQIAANSRSLAATGIMAGVLAALVHAGVAAAALPALAAVIAAGAFTYVASLALLWLVTGRPSGPETDVVALAGTLVARFAMRPRVQPVTSPQ